MGSFRHHITGSVITGVACGTMSKFVFKFGWWESVGAFALCALAGILPDVDSPVSRPAEIIIRIFSVTAPIFLIQYLDYTRLTEIQVFLVALAAFLLSGYGIRELMKRFTVHRGVIHSVPAAVIWGAIVFISFRHTPMHVRYVFAAASVVGYLTQQKPNNLLSKYEPK